LRLLLLTSARHPGWVAGRHHVLVRRLGVRRPAPARGGSPARACPWVGDSLATSGVS